MITSILPILYGILGISVLIAFHELGHFLFAKLFNVRAPSFSIGFGPRLITKKIGETEFALSAIPFGGYVEIAGMVEPGQGEQLYQGDNSDRSFGQKPYYQQFLILMGGIIFNILFAAIIFFYLFCTGVPSNSLLQNQASKPLIATVVENSPAAKAGIKEGDFIFEINGQKINNVGEFIDTLHKNTAPSITLLKKEKDAENAALVTINFESDVLWERRKIGVHFESEEILPQSITEAFKNSILETGRWIQKIVWDFVGIVKNRELKNVAGPIAIIGIAGKSATVGYKFLLILLSLISINLAILNLIPFPILDGGQLLFYTIEAVIGRPLPAKLRETIHIITWIAFILLFLYLSTKDIMKFFSN